MKKILFILTVFVGSGSFCHGQVSLSTDLSILRNFKKGQEFWAFGQNIIIDLHLSPKDGAYFYGCYYSGGRFVNPLKAEAKSPSTIPQEINFTNSAKVRLKEFSMGWKHYLKGRYDGEIWNLYSITGFGIIFGKAFNNYSKNIDTALYNLPERPVNATGRFRRLTFDVGLGFEVELGSEIYLYTEAKAWIPASSYPSKYLFSNDNAPFAGVAGLGLRVLF